MQLFNMDDLSFTRSHSWQFPSSERRRGAQASQSRGQCGSCAPFLGRRVHFVWSPALEVPFRKAWRSRLQFHQDVMMIHGDVILVSVAVLYHKASRSPLRLEGKTRGETYRRQVSVQKDPTARHEPEDGANVLQNIKATRNARQKLDVREADFRRFPVHQASCRKYPNSCMWVTVHLSKNGDQCQRVNQNVVVVNFHTVFVAVQAQIQNLQLQDGGLCGLSEQVDRVFSPWRKGSVLNKQSSKQCQSKVYVFGGPEMCFAGKCPQHPEAADI